MIEGLNATMLKDRPVEAWTLLPLRGASPVHVHFSPSFIAESIVNPCLRIREQEILEKENKTVNLPKVSAYLPPPLPVLRRPLNH